MKRPFISDSFRWIEFDQLNQRLKLTGSFTSSDLRVLARWLEKAKESGVPMGVIDVHLSPTKP